MRKFNPNYSVTVYSNKDTVTVKHPITCKFKVTRGLYSESSNAVIQLYNLSEETRNSIYHDTFVFEPENFKYVNLEAGCGDEESTSLIFKGKIKSAYSYKTDDQTDIITEIQAVAMDVFDYSCSYTFEAGTSYKDIYKTLAGCMPNIKIENIGNLEGSIKTPTTFSGNCIEELNKLTGGNTFVDNGMLNTIRNNEFLNVPVTVIDDDNGILQMPRRSDTNIEIKMLFEPNLLVGQPLEIKSEIYTNFNGQFKVIEFTHDCMMSETQAGTRTTLVKLYMGAF